MKKILSLTLAALMLVSMIPTAMAAETNPASQGTTITAVGTKGASYEVTVPATLNPGQTGNVTATGTWAANQTLKVTAPTSVNLVNGSDSIPVSITFAGIEEVGNDNGETESATAAVTVGTVDTSTFFGTWTGTLTYTVDLVTEEAAETLITFTIEGTEYQAEKGMTWAEWCESDYNIPSTDPNRTQFWVEVQYICRVFYPDGNPDSPDVEYEWVCTDESGDINVVKTDLIESRTYYLI